EQYPADTLIQNSRSMTHGGFYGRLDSQDYTDSYCIMQICRLNCRRIQRSGPVTGGGLYGVSGY
ncbi:MAG: hypothetical protein ACREUV_05565, partial [Burkholderiales bacterium]